MRLAKHEYAMSSGCGEMKMRVGRRPMAEIDDRGLSSCDEVQDCRDAGRAAQSQLRDVAGKWLAR